MAQPGHGADPGAADAYLEVQVGPRRVAGGARQADQLPA